METALGILLILMLIGGILLSIYRYIYQKGVSSVYNPTESELFDDAVNWLLRGIEESRIEMATTYNDQIRFEHQARYRHFIKRLKAIRERRIFYLEVLADKGIDYKTLWGFGKSWYDLSRKEKVKSVKNSDDLMAFLQKEKEI